MTTLLKLIIEKFTPTETIQLAALAAVILALAILGLVLLSPSQHPIHLISPEIRESACHHRRPCILRTL